LSTFRTHRIRWLFARLSTFIRSKLPKFSSSERTSF
jgi:hypothetical protein